MTKSNSIEELARSFDEQGYVIVPAFMDHARVASIFEEISQVLAISAGQGIFHDKGDARFRSEEMYMNLKLSNDVLRSHCYDVIGRLNVVHSAFSSSLIDDLARRVYGMPVARGPIQVRIDDTTNDRVLPMHQELMQMSLLTINAWVPLVPIDGTCGGMRIVPGSHKHGLVKHVSEAPGAYDHIAPHRLDLEPPIDVRMNAGDALLFHPFLHHASLPNIGDRVRWVAIARFCELGTMPYLRHPDAKFVMSRNPSASDPGAEFVARHVARPVLA
jgi:ectoine hydroxylase-related dioxygenase (phytanoyl-CoA dioxygenase family)